MNIEKINSNISKKTKIGTTIEYYQEIDSTHT